MKLSKYNIYVKNNENLKIVNTEAKTIVKINDSKIQRQIEKIDKGELVNIDDNITSLKSLGIIVETNTKEISIDPLAETLLITLFVTKQCNFRCIYCYEKFSDDIMDLQKYNQILSFIKKKLNNNNYHNIRINLFGGEPLLEYDKIVYFLIKLKVLLEGRKNISLSVGLTSNGYLLDILKYKKLVDLGLHDVQITVDGFAENHNKKRRLRYEQEGTAERIMSNLDAISSYEYHTDIILRTNFDSDIIKEEKDFLIHCKERFNNQFIMHFEAIKKFNKNYNGECICSNQEQKLVIELIKYCKKNNIDNHYNYILSGGFYACSQCSPNSYVFNTDLEISKCTVLLDFDKSYIGKLNFENEFIESENLKLWNKSDLKCNDCNLFPLCLNRNCPGNKIKNHTDCNYEKIKNNFINIIESVY